MTTGFFEARGLRFRLDREGAGVSGAPSLPVRALVEALVEALRGTG
ncbi:hypothetical protein [Sorangium sp. So ce854]